MAITSIVPFELGVNDMIPLVTNMIGELRFNENIETLEYQLRFIEAHTFGAQDFGDGIVLNSEIQLGAQNTYSTTSSLQTLDIPKQESEYIKVDTKLFWRTSITDYLLSKAVLDGNMFDRMLTLLSNRNAKSMIEYYYQTVLAMVNAYIPTQATQKVVIELQDPDSATNPIDRNNIYVSNTQKIANAQQEILDNLSTYDSAYTDSSTTFTKLGGNKLQTLFNKGFINENETFGIQNMLNPGVNKVLAKTSIVHTIPEKDILNANVTANQRFICAIYGLDKHALIKGRNYAKAWEDASTTYKTFYNHDQYGTGTFKNVPAVVLIGQYPTVLRKTKEKFVQTKEYLKALNAGKAIAAIEKDVEVSKDKV